MNQQDFRSGALAIAGALVLAVAATLSPGEVAAELWDYVGPLGLFGGSTLLRWLHRPSDGDPESTMRVSSVLNLMGLPKLPGATVGELERLAGAGWVVVGELEPEVGQTVMAVVGGDVVVAQWLDGGVEDATHWRRLPDPPR